MKFVKKTILLITALSSVSVLANGNGPEANIETQKVSESKYALAALDLAPNMIFLSQGSVGSRPEAIIISLYGEKKSRGVRAICDFAFENNEESDVPVFIDMDCKAGTRIGHFLNTK